MSSAFQNQSLDPSPYDLSRLPQNPTAAATSASPNSTTSPPLPALSFSLRQSPTRRKPLPPGAKPLPLGIGISYQFPKPPTFKSPVPVAALDPVVQLPHRHVPLGTTPTLLSPKELAVRDFNRPYHEDYSPTLSWATQASRNIDIRVQLPTPRGYPKSPAVQSHARVISESSLNISPRIFRLTTHTRSVSTSNMPAQPNISLPEGIMNQDSGSFDPVDEANKKSSSRFTSFFRWGSLSEQGAGSAPMPSIPGVDRASLLLMSPTSYHSASGKSIPAAIDIPRANASQSNSILSDSGVSFPPLSPSYASLEAIEEEVRAVSADLAASIRREMDLEDLIDRLQAEATERGGNGRRTSDYFSDAGTPVRILDLDTKDVDAEKLVRKVEQEKAQLRLDMLGKVQEERDKRKVVELQVKELEELVAKSTDGSHLAPPDAPARIKDLETTLEEAKRKLAEERLMKENFEDLLSALKEELEANRNERDNLRDEVVPQLKARVEGLETEASDLQKLMYEHSRMQQELMTLKTENESLAAAIQEKTQSQLEAQAQVQAEIQAQVKAQVQEAQEQAPQTPQTPIVQGAIQAQMVQAQLVQIQTQIQTRPQSIAQSGYATPITPTSLPLNPKDRESLAERLRDVEVQRDALHKALKSLRDRQLIEAKKSRERIKALESERDRALHPSLRRQGRDKEVSALRREVDRLRQRADNALEQKFVCERSLSTLMMDLEKAEQETSTLRVLLQEHDDLIAQHEELKDSHARLSGEVSQLKHGVNEASSVTLKQAYCDLQTLHERSLARLGELESRSANPSSMGDHERRLSEVNEESQDAVQQLRKSLTSAEVNRDIAMVEAEAYRKRAESLQKSESMHMQEERNLAAQLRISSERVEELATQVRAQLASNETLRERLADCIARGELEQRASAKKINDLQDKLRALEDKVLEAQQLAEDAVSKHEDEIRLIKDTHTSQLRRLKAATAQTPSLKSPLTPLLRSPKLEWTSIRRLSTSDSTKTEILEKRVSELEQALNDADDEMGMVVGKMNMAQIEVLELQTERDEAVRQTRRLQADFISQRAKHERIF